MSSPSVSPEPVNLDTVEATPLALSSTPVIDLTINDSLEKSIGYHEETSDEQLLEMLDSLEGSHRASVLTPLPCYTSNPPKDSGCFSLNSLRDTNVTVRKNRKKQQARGSRINPELSSIVPLTARIDFPSLNSLSPSFALGALRALPPNRGDL